MDDSPAKLDQPLSTPNRRSRRFNFWTLSLFVGLILLGAGVAGILWRAQIVRQRQNLKEQVVGAAKAILAQSSDSTIAKANHMAIRPAIEPFWKWFSDNSQRFRSLAKHPSKEELLDEIMAKLHAIHPGLYFEVSEPHNGVNEFVITAAGNKELFPVVDEIISLAPKLDAWEFTALKGASGFGFNTQYGEVTLKPKELWFLPLTAGPNAERFGLRLGVPNLPHKDEAAAQHAAWIVLDTGLGERQCAESIEHLEVVTLPERPKEKGLFPLTELDDYLKWRKSRQRSDN